MFLLQKQPSKVFCKKSCSQKFLNLRRKIPVLESHYNSRSLQAYNFIKARIQHRFFPVNIARFLRAPILKNSAERLLLFSSYSPSALSFLLAACPISKIIFMQIYLAFKTYEFFHFCRLVFSRFLNQHGNLGSRFLDQRGNLSSRLLVSRGNLGNVKECHLSFYRMAEEIRLFQSTFV